MSKAIAEYRKAQKAVAEARKAAEKIVKQAFNETLKELFADNESLISFTWTQYTPYFNDGDTCVFGVNGDYPKIKFIATDGKLVEWDENYGENTADGAELDYGGPQYKLYEEEAKMFSKAVSEFLGVFSEDDLQALFGDHAEITASAKGTEVEEYEHD